MRLVQALKQSRWPVSYNYRHPTTGPVSFWCWSCCAKRIYKAMRLGSEDLASRLKAKGIRPRGPLCCWSSRAFLFARAQLPLFPSLHLAGDKCYQSLDLSEPLNARSLRPGVWEISSSTLVSCRVYGRAQLVRPRLAYQQQQLCRGRLRRSVHSQAQVSTIAAFSTGGRRWDVQIRPHGCVCV